jgi:hypothetical protein
MHAFPSGIFLTPCASNGRIAQRIITAGDTLRRQPASFVTDLIASPARTRRFFSLLKMPWLIPVSVFALQFTPMGASESVIHE